MAFVSGESSHLGAAKVGNSSFEKEEEDNYGGRWYFSRKEIEEDSPSRRDGIDLKKEAYLRKSYCTFLQDLGMRLKVPQVTIATAIVFCHRFFLRQSHAKNERRTIATVCMFLAGKVEETPRPLKDVILVSYEIIHKKDPSAIQKIKQKEVYEQQKELILLGERIVLATLGFDFNVHHPYKPLVEAIKKFKVAQNALAQVAWNFVNDGLRTSLCLQYKAHHIAAGAIFLAAKFLKVKLPSDGEKVWWQEFDVTPRQLEDVSNQMLELYEQNRTGQSQANEVEGSMGGGANNQPIIAAAAVSESSISVNGPSPDAGMSSIRQGLTGASTGPSGSISHTDGNNHVRPHSAQKHSDGNGSCDDKRGFRERNVDESKHSLHEVEKKFGYGGSTSESSRGVVSNKTSNEVEAKDYWQDGGHGFPSSSTGNQMSNSGEAAKDFSPADVITKIDKNKVKAALEKRRRLRNDVEKRKDIMDDDDLIERELENGIELSMEDGNLKKGKYKDGSKALSRQELDDEFLDQEGSGVAKNFRSADPQLLNGNFKSRAPDSEHDRSHEAGFENAEEGELSSLDEQEFPSPKYRNSSVKAANSRRATEASGTGRTDGLKRNKDDYEYSKTVNDRVVGPGRQSEGMQQYDSAIYPERDFKKQRYTTHG